MGESKPLTPFGEVPFLKVYNMDSNPRAMKTDTKKKILAYGMVGIMIVVVVTVAASAMVS